MSFRQWLTSLFGRDSNRGGLSDRPDWEKRYKNVSASIVDGQLRIEAYSYFEGQNDLAAYSVEPYGGSNHIWYTKSVSDAKDMVPDAVIEQVDIEKYEEYLDA